MTDPIAPVKNPRRVPWTSQVDDPVGTAGTVADIAPSQETRAMADFRFNSQTGSHEATRDGVYERQADNPVNRDRVQLRKGYAVTEADAKTLKRVGAWPGETDEDEVEAQATANARAMNAPANKTAPAPEDK